jgi:hypothetical protein
VTFPLSFFTVLYWFPFSRDLLMAFGLCDVSRESFEQILCKQGRGNIAIVAVGGAAESLDAHPGFYHSRPQSHFHSVTR